MLHRTTCGLASQILLLAVQVNSTQSNGMAWRWLEEALEGLGWVDVVVDLYSFTLDAQPSAL